MALVAATPHNEPEDRDLHCLAAGIYFESRGEPLEGQLAVAHVILNRAASGRFATNACGVLTQRGQFSFVRRGVIPEPTPSATWRTAVAVARIARAEQWHSPVPGALFFHARHVSPGWSRPVVARLGNHIFYR
jgi:spore germination cell wall hydrolase CwlJ-like protein